MLPAHRHEHLVRITSLPCKHLREDLPRGRAVLKLRDEGAIGDEVLRRVQRDLDLETMLLESGEDDAPESPYDTL